MHQKMLLQAFQQPPPPATGPMLLVAQQLVAFASQAQLSQLVAQFGAQHQAHAVNGLPQ